jgi:hypothetical protein
MQISTKIFSVFNFDMIFNQIKQKKFELIFEDLNNKITFNSKNSIKNICDLIIDALVKCRDTNSDEIYVYYNSNYIEIEYLYKQIKFYFDKKLEFIDLLYEIKLVVEK